MLIIILWYICFFIFTGSILSYYLYLIFNTKRPWGLKVNVNFSPFISILIAFHNEEKFIYERLENLRELTYPRERMELILIDDASTDKTLEKISDFSVNNPEFQMKIIKQKSWKGKTSALNEGLKVANSQIIIVTDADVLLSKDIIEKTLMYFADPTVGAISGHGMIDNADQNWLTKAESGYLNSMSLLRLGESKIHSTLRFEGSFCAFRRNAFEKFDEETGTDDSGTAFQVVQNNFRAIFIPDATMVATAYTSLFNRNKSKLRRATHLTALWFRCLNLLVQGKLMLPKRIAIPEIFISIINPFIFVLLAFLTLISVFYFPMLLFPFTLVLLALGLYQKTRYLMVQVIIDQFILFYSIILHITNKKYVSWDK